jgi:hypothetical protein
MMGGRARDAGPAFIVILACGENLPMTGRYRFGDADGRSEAKRPRPYQAPTHCRWCQVKWWATPIRSLFRRELRRRGHSHRLTT